jgi:hypothetical protein
VQKRSRVVAAAIVAMVTQGSGNGVVVSKSGRPFSE